MRLDHAFTVPAPVDEAWTVLLDVPRIAPCMPGATLTEFDGEAFAGTVKVKLGPMSLTYRGKGRFVEVDEAAHRVVIEASGKETRGSGTAAATVTATLASEGDVARVDVGTDLTITGRPAQFGRGMLADVGERLVGQFAERLAATLGEPAGVGPAEQVAAEGSAAGAVGSAATEDDADVEPIDLLEITGVSAIVRRYGPYAAAAVAAALVVWLVARRRRAH